MFLANSDSNCKIMRELAEAQLRSSSMSSPYLSTQDCGNIAQTDCMDDHN